MLQKTGKTRKNGNSNGSAAGARRQNAHAATAATLPTCAVLHPVGQAGEDSAGVVLVRQLIRLRPGRYAFSILAHAMPAPGELGPYNAYQGLVFVPGLITWTFRLFLTDTEMPTWAGTWTESTLNPVPGGIVQVRPYNTSTGAVGAPVLEGTLS